MCKRVHGSINGQISHPSVAFLSHYGCHVRIRAGRGEISGEPQDEHHDEAFRRRCRKRYRDMVIWFPSAEDLVLLKLRTGRHTDFDDGSLSGLVTRWTSDTSAVGRAASALWTN